MKRNIECCDYSLKLHWGGRPYKDATKKVAKIPNTKLVDGVVTIKPLRRKTGGINTKSGQMVSLKQFFKDDGGSERIYTDASTPDDATNMAQPSMTFRSPVDDITRNILFDPMPFIQLHGLHLPSPLPDVLSSSTYFMNLFEFYLKETCHLLVPVPRELYKKNPFYVVLPQIAMHNHTLLYLLLAFGANHRNMMFAQSTSAIDVLTEQPLIQLTSFSKEWNLFDFFPLDSYTDDRFSSVSSNALIDTLLSNVLKELVKKLKDEKERKSDGTLATVMMLAAYDIFFSDKRRKWRAHVYGARNLMKERLCTSQEEALTIIDIVDKTDARFFLQRWFTYVDIIGSLSSTNRVITTEKLSSLKYEFKHYKEVGNERKLALNDIECSTGMEPKVLSLLADVSWIISERERLSETDNETDDIPTDLLLQMLELDYKITKHLEESEVQRDKVYHLFFSEQPVTEMHNSKIYDGYSILRATNLIFGLTGSLQLKRRALNMPLQSVIVKDLLLRITTIVDKYIPLASSSTSCVIFCLFCCGCDLLDKSMIKHRSVYMDRIEALNQRGISSAGMAKRLMQQCWAQNKCWWDLLKENNLDVTFAI